MSLTNSAAVLTNSAGFGIVRPLVLPYVGRVAVDGKTPGERLHDLMAERNLTAYALATRTGLSENGITRIAQGRTKHTRIETWDALAEALGVTREFLLTGEDPDEEDIATMEQLHAWEAKVARQRERYIRRILEAQQEAMAATLRQSTDLTPEAREAAARALEGTKAVEHQSARGSSHQGRGEISA